MPKTQAKARRKGQQRGPRTGTGGRPFLSGFVSGAIVGAVAALALAYWPVDITGGDVSAPDGAAESASLPTVDFEFMYRLPKERVITNVEPYVPASDQPVTEPSQADPAKEYLLQAAAFRGRDEANAMRAQLILATNMGAEIESARDQSGRTWHRVYVGPFVDKAEMQRTLARLQEMDVSAVPLERPKT